MSLVGKTITCFKQFDDAVGDLGEGFPYGQLFERLYPNIFYPDKENPIINNYEDFLNAVGNLKNNKNEEINYYQVCEKLYGTTITTTLSPQQSSLIWQGGRHRYIRSRHNRYGSRAKRRQRRRFMSSFKNKNIYKRKHKHCTTRKMRTKIMSTI